MRRYIVLFLAFAVPAHAEEQQTIIMPRALIEEARNWIGHPDPTTAVRLFLSLAACEASNADKPPTPDNCPSVTAALKAQAKP